MAGRFLPPPTYAEPMEVDDCGNSSFNPVWRKWFNAISAPLGVDGIPSAINLDADVTGENTSLDTNYVYGISAETVTHGIVPLELGGVAGSTSILVTMNEGMTGNEDVIPVPGFLLFWPGDYWPPTGGVRSIDWTISGIDGRELPVVFNTRYTTSTPEGGIAYIMWGAESSVTRFVSGGNYGLKPAGAGLFMVEYRAETNTFVAVFGLGAEEEWTQLDSDYVFMILYKGESSIELDSINAHVTWSTDLAGGSWTALRTSKVWWSDVSGTFPSGDPTEDLVITFYDFYGLPVGSRTLRGTLTSSTGLIVVTEVNDTGITTGFSLAGDGTNSVLATITGTLDNSNVIKAQVSWTAIGSAVVESGKFTTVQAKGASTSFGSMIRTCENNFVTGTGIAGTDNTAEDLKTIVLPANSLSVIGDRCRIRAYWTGDTGANVTGAIELNGVPVSNTTDGGGATFQVVECWLHYIDSTHANIMEEEAGGLGALSAPNVAGFAWTSDQDTIFSQDAAAGNHCILYFFAIDFFPA